MTHCRTRLWVDGELKTEDFPLQEVSEHLTEDGALVWVDMCNPDHEVLRQLADELGFDEHAVEDTIAHAERTKATRYTSHTFLTVYATALAPPLANDLESRLLLSRVSIFVLHAGVVTVRHEIDPQRPVFDIDEVVRRWDENADLLRMGPPALLHGLLDVIVDAQFDTIQLIDDAIEALEDGLFDDRAHTRTIQRSTYRLRKELVELRRVVLPMREVINTIMRRRAERSDSVELDSWYSDLYDHVIRAAEWTESLRDMITTVFETNLSLQDARLNTIMKKLTGWAAIIAVPTAVTGWYGQNVPYPGFSQAAGVVASALIIIVTSGLLYIAFKRRGWI
ncbi:magnesium transporter CorA family protein [Mycobacterium sp. CVI_P3]|uniref:Magnesium transporter CorA family protein n=1 Tax=Mycobacterium pinniadriaticum TaxID=2994102 RepID=A0ABT3SN19_9MYCO|nr:magnesium transporter CorA family protein [Mycobacterium pinniadriaticum]MCX2934117.1 magnesium transporter CorA family protein [Mycobacterium pinniadriaticum]MCX2940539.1 magnesium transporter CorA family protein [Mycobacterium pinniadriaticum]